MGIQEISETPMNCIKQVSVFSKDDLENILKSEKNVVLKFYWDGCPPCKVYQKMINSYQTDLEVTMCNIDVHSPLSLSLKEKYSVRSVPYTVILGSSLDEIKYSKLGGISKQEFDGILEKYFK